MKKSYLKMMLLGIVALNACSLYDQLPVQSDALPLQVPVGCKLVTGGTYSKVTIPEGVTLVTGGEGCP